MSSFRWTARILIVMWGSSLAIYGQANGNSVSGSDEPVKLSTLPRRFVKDEVSIWTSPFRKSSYESHTVKKYLIPFGVITATLIAVDRKTASNLPNTLDQTRWSGRASQMGAWYSLAGVSGVTYLAGKWARNDHAAETGLLALEALGHAQVATFVIKELSNRERPIDGENAQRRGFWKGGNSFPSGHTSGAFAVATVFAYEYRDHIAAPIIAYSLASLVGVSRVGARKHWLSDIFAGGSMGFMMGRDIYRRNHNRSLPGSKVSLNFTPTGPAVTWRF